jgi:chromosome segregation ATPase
MARSKQKDLGDELEKFEEEVENLKNTKMKIFGITMTPTNIGAAFALISAMGGALYGGFEVYKDYMNMKEIISNIDTDAIAARNDIIETKLNEAIDYTRDIKDGLRDDIIKIETHIDRLEDKIDASELRIKDTQKEIESTLTTLRDENNQLQRDVTASIREVEGIVRESEKDTRDDLRILERDMNEKIQEALDNPLTR